MVPLNQTMQAQTTDTDAISNLCLKFRTFNILCTKLTFCMHAHDSQLAPLQ